MNNNSKILKSILWHSYSRCSTPLQTESTIAQIEQAEKICKENKWNLSDRSFEDFGVSGGNFKNWRSGQLGMFFDAVDNGEIQTPCGLIIESLSRFSRSDALEVANKFRDYVKKGVYIHVVQKGMTYEKEDLIGEKVFNLVMIILEAIANENARQTHIQNCNRGIAKKKRKLMSGQLNIYTKHSPSWIDVNQIGTDNNNDPIYEYSLNEEKVKIVKRIFEERIAGVGTQQIAINLNKDLIPNLSKYDAPWTFNIVSNILRARSTCGFIQLCTSKDVEDEHGTIKKKRVKQLDSNGNQIEVKIYPEAISEETFQQARLEMDKSNGTFKVSKKEQNVFSRLCVCGYCKKGINLSSNEELTLSKFALGKDFSMHRKHNGNTNKVNGKGHVYFKCSNPNCERKMMPEYYIENLLFKFLNEVNINSLFGQTDDRELVKLENQLNKLNAELKKTEKQREKIYNLLLDDDADDFLAEKYSKIKTTILNQQKEIKSLNNKIIKESSLQKNVKKDWKRVLDLINSDQEKDTNRMRLNKLLRDKIKKIRIFSEGVPEGKLKFNKKTYSIENKVAGNTLSIRVEFKGDVVRLLTYDVKNERAVCINAEEQTSKQKVIVTKPVVFKLKENPKGVGGNFKSRNPIFEEKEFLQDLDNNDLPVRVVGKKWKVNFSFVQYHRLKRRKES